MATSHNTWLIFAAFLSALAALLHVAIVFGGAPWYRFFGAGEGMALAAEAGRVYPAIITFGIAFVLAGWAAYALSGAGVIAGLPLLKWGLVAITAVYLVRGLALFPLLVVARDQATPFLVWSSLICIGCGVVHLVGVVQTWERL
jgi:hypothetical protein